jgi:hypothetical protein
VDAFALHGVERCWNLCEDSEGGSGEWGGGQGEKEKRRVLFKKTHASRIQQAVKDILTSQLLNNKNYKICFGQCKYSTSNIILQIHLLKILERVIEFAKIHLLLFFLSVARPCTNITHRSLYFSFTMDRYAANAAIAAFGAGWALNSLLTYYVRFMCRLAISPAGCP